MFKTKRLDPAHYTGIDIAGIIGAPLIAASHANSLMAKEQIKFLMDFCFTKKGDTYEPVMIRMSISRTVVNPASDGNKEPSFQQINATIQLPLLTVIPISSLAVQSVEVDFNLEVTSQLGENSGGALGATPNSPSDSKPVRLMGKVGSQSQGDRPSGGRDTSKKQYSETGSSNLKVNIKSGPLPLPLGITSILNVYAKNLYPVDLSAGTDTKKT